MTKTPNSSIRIPTPEDFRACGYPDEQAAILPVIFTAIRDSEKGWCTPSKLRIAARSKQVLSKALNNARDKQHLTSRPRSRREHLWTFGAGAALIPKHQADLLAAPEMPTLDDFWANGFSDRQGQYAAEIVRALNDNNATLTTDKLAELVGTTPLALNASLKMLKRLDCIKSRVIRSATRRAGKLPKREFDEIELLAPGVRALPRAELVQRPPGRRIPEELQEILDRVNWAMVTGGDLMRKFIEAVYPERVAALWEIASDCGFTGNSLYGTKQYPGPIRKLRSLGIAVSERIGPRLKWTIIVPKISEALPQLHGAIPSGSRPRRRRPRLGTTLRPTRRLDRQMKAWIKSAIEKCSTPADKERMTAYANIAGATGNEFVGTYSDLAMRLDIDYQVVSLYLQRGERDGFFEKSRNYGSKGVEGITLSPVRSKFRSAASKLPRFVTLKRDIKAEARRKRTNGAANSRANGKPATHTSNGHPKDAMPLPALGTNRAAANGHTTGADPSQSPVVLRGPRETPLVFGVEKKRLTKAEYDVIQTLLESPIPLAIGQLDTRSGRTGARVILARLVKKDSDWAKVIYLPGSKRNGYRIRAANEVVT